MLKINLVESATALTPDSLPTGTVFLDGDDDILLVVDAINPEDGDRVFVRIGTERPAECGVEYINRDGVSDEVKEIYGTISGHVS